MKTSKNFRLSKESLVYISALLENYSFESETDIIERALSFFAHETLNEEELKKCKQETFKK